MVTVIDIDIAIGDGDWPDEKALRALADRAIAAALARLAVTDGDTEVSLLFTGDAAVRALNKQWRGLDKPTNVLSFPAFDIVPGSPLPPALGDIVIARETVEREAALDNKPFDHHLTHLMVHGFLHLLGYDHETDAQADLMEALETGILADLEIADPYAEDSQGK